MKLALKLDTLTKAINQDIRGGLDSFIRAGEKLKQIRDDNLYATGYQTFSAYCDGEIIWGKSHSYSAINVFEKCGQLLTDHPELRAAGQTRVVKLLKYMKDDETTRNLLEMAAHTPAKGFEDNLRNLEGKVAQHDQCEHLETEPFSRCVKCGKFLRTEGQG